MAAQRTNSLDRMFDSHPSLSASLESMENRSPVFGLPSQHSGFKSEESEADTESNSEEPWSPPAWRNQQAAGGWYRHQPYPEHNTKLKPSASPSRSRGTSPQYESAREREGETIVPANIPLPRGSRSPTKEQSPERETESCHEGAQDFGQQFAHPEETVPVVQENANNYIRFAVRAEVQHRTEPIETALSWLRSYINHITKSWTSLSSTLLMFSVAVALLRILIRTPPSPPVPDLVKVAGLARSFEPLIYYSENGVQQISDLQETGVAVWDLGESVRSANMTSAPMIVNELDSLSESLKTLGIELTKFFANVDGDIDGILIVMEWAQRELSALSALPLTSLSSAFTNLHALFSRVGILENRSTGLPTPVGRIFTELFGATHSQHTHRTLHRTFNEFLGVLEESINSELTYSTSLFSLFESIDRQFLNLQRTVIRESDTQERLEGEFLSSLWVRLVGPNSATLRKYEKNKDLLASVRAKTTRNKSLLVEHNGKLVALKGNLENLRRKLVSPLVRRGDGCTIGVEEQIRGLEGTYEHLKRVRETQKGRVLEVLYGVGGRRSTIGKDEARGIEGK
ncbi:MAG: hypothetical protein Q9191_005118 [Dirinaria sp. TL-2023a]